MVFKKIVGCVGPIQNFLKELRENGTHTVTFVRIGNKNSYTNCKSSLNHFISYNHSNKTYQHNHTHIKKKKRKKTLNLKIVVHLFSLLPKDAYFSLETC